MFMCILNYFSFIKRVGTRTQGERRAGKDARGEQEEGGRIPEKRSSGAAKEGGGTISGARRASKTKRRGYAEEETARGGRTGKTDDGFGQEQITTEVVLCLWSEMSASSLLVR